MAFVVKLTKHTQSDMHAFHMYRNCPAIRGRDVEEKEVKEGDPGWYLCLWCDRRAKLEPVPYPDSVREDF